MTGDTVVQVLLGLLVLAVGYTGFVTASRATRSQAASADRAVDAGAFERARQIYEGALETLRDELAATRSDLLSARSEISGMREDSLKLRQEITRLRAQIARLDPDALADGADPA